MAAQKWAKLPSRKKRPGEPKGGQDPIDHEKLKEMYVNGPNYGWAAFCRAHNFNPNCRANLWRNEAGGFQAWKLEWQKAQLATYDEELTPDLMSTTKLVTMQRISFVKDWVKRARYMRTLFDAMIEKHGASYNHDQQNTLAIQAGRVSRKFLLDPTEFNAIASAAAKLQEIELRALLVVADPEKLKRLESLNEDESEQLPEVEVSRMGAQMSNTEAIQLMASYYDQFQSPPAKVQDVELIHEEDQV